MPRNVGFDLDMTLIDARVPIAALIDEIAAETGLGVDGAEMAAALGPPLETRLADAGFAEEEIALIAGRYRERYPAIVSQARPMPGAAAAIEAVRSAGGRVIVVTGKATANAKRHISALGWPADAVVGDVFGDGKGLAIEEFGAELYVGDHIGDMHGAAAAGVTGVGVATGPCSAEDLYTAGAAVVLDSLTEFPALFAGERV